jgi:hypothetical protein
LVRRVARWDPAKTRRPGFRWRRSCGSGWNRSGGGNTHSGRQFLCSSVQHGGPRRSVRRALSTGYETRREEGHCSSAAERTTAVCHERDSSSSLISFRAAARSLLTPPLPSAMAQASSHPAVGLIVLAARLQHMQAAARGGHQLHGRHTRRGRPDKCWRSGLFLANQPLARPQAQATSRPHMAMLL